MRLLRLTLSVPGPFHKSRFVVCVNSNIPTQLTIDLTSKCNYPIL